MTAGRRQAVPAVIGGKSTGILARFRGNLPRGHTLRQHDWRSHPARRREVVSEVAVTESEATELERLESVIRRGVRAFVDVGNALKEIRDRRLYRDTHKTFEDYCQSRWGMERRHPYHLMNAAAAVEQLKMCTRVHILPACEAHVRPLLRLCDHNLQIEAWGRVVERAGGDLGGITAKLVREEVARFLPAREVPRFDWVAERDAIHAWLAGRLADWPDGFRDKFADLVANVARDIQEQFT